VYTRQVAASPGKRAGLEALWARAGAAGGLRLEVEAARVEQQERALADAHAQLDQWDALVRGTNPEI
jgi:hypothetical protein